MKFIKKLSKAKRTLISIFLLVGVAAGGAVLALEYSSFNKFSMSSTGQYDIQIQNGVGISNYGICNTKFNLPKINQRFDYLFNLNVKNRSLPDFAANATNDWLMKINELSEKQSVLKNSLTNLPTQEKKEIQKQIDHMSIDKFLYNNALAGEDIANYYKLSSTLLLSGSIPIAILGSLLVAFWTILIVNYIKNRRNKENVGPQNSPIY